MADAFELSYAGVGFSLDAATVVRADQTPRTKGTNSYAVDGGADVRNHQPLADFIDELDRIMPFRYIHDFDYPSPSPRIDSLALKDIDDAQDVKARIGEFYYPSTAAKWSVFRGLATSTQLKRMMVATNNGASAASFVIQSKPLGAVGTTNYRVSTPMRILAPRCVGETIGTVDGLYLITLVDERFYFQGTSASLNLTAGESWASVVTRIAAVLGITVSFPDLPAVYERPEADSQLWTFRENAALLLDAVANNLGCVVVRDLSGNYGLMRHETSAATAALNRTGLKARTAGGNLYTPGGMPVGSLKGSRNGVCPAGVNVVFPKYVTGDDPVPHFLNPRYGESRPSAWYETSLADTHVVPVPIQSGGIYVSGLTGVGDDTVHVAGKAYLDTEASVLPSNGSGLTALAMRVAQDRYTFLASVAFDETYPGTVKLLPEGIHDIVWTYSARRRQATTRMVRGPWTMLPDTLQHAAPALSGRGYNPKGVGGPSVAQSHTGKAYPTANVASGGGTFASGVSPVTVSLASEFASGAVSVSLGRVDYLPTDYRWKGTVNGEAVLFEGTSGGTSSGTASIVGVVQRAVDGTVPATHASGSTVTLSPSAAVYGVNLVEHGRMQFVHPGQWRSGGIQGAVAAPQVQTVRVMSASGVVLNGVTHYSGQVLSYNPTKTSGLQFPVEGNAWIVERSQLPVTSGYRYGGQLAGYSPSEVNSSGFPTRPTAPVYVVDEHGGTGSSSTPTPEAKWSVSVTNVAGTVTSGSWTGGRQHLVGFKQLHGDVAVGGVTNVFDASNVYQYNPGAVLRYISPGQGSQTAGVPTDSFGRHVAAFADDYYEIRDGLGTGLSEAMNTCLLFAVTTDAAPLNRFTYPRIGYYRKGARAGLSAQLATYPVPYTGVRFAVWDHTFALQQINNYGAQQRAQFHDITMQTASGGDRRVLMAGMDSYAFWGRPKIVATESISIQSQRGWCGTLADGTKVVEGIIIAGGAGSVAAPSIDVVTPEYGITGDAVTIAGSGFISGYVSVTFDGIAATITSGSSTVLGVTVPTRAGGNDFDTQISYGTVSVTNSGGPAATATMGFRWNYPNPYGAPSVSGLSVTSGTTSGGTAVSLTGENLLPGTSVTIGGRDCTFTRQILASGSLQFRTPIGISGPQTVTVIDPYGRTASKFSGFTYG